MTDETTTLPEPTDDEPAAEPTEAPAEDDEDEEAS